MKVSGINYFFNESSLPTGDFSIFYAFNDGAGDKVASVSGGNSLYTGTLSSVGSFWSRPSNGFFTGQSLKIENASGLYSPNWTMVFSYEKVNTDECVLFSNMGIGSGFKIGVTTSNKPYLESQTVQPVVAASNNNFSSKNLVSFSYTNNFLSIGYFNFNSRSLEIDSFDYPFQIQESNNWIIAPSFTGYIDGFLYLSSYLSPNVQAQLFSGFFANPTGIDYVIEQIGVTGITGYENVEFFETGITGYIITPGGDEGRDYYTGQFPTYHTMVALTGIVNSGIAASGVTGVQILEFTGNSFPIYEYETGYIAEYGMQKVQLFSFVRSDELVKCGVDFEAFNDIYNVNTVRNYSGYQLVESYPTGNPNFFWNGIALGGENWNISGLFLSVPGSLLGDEVFLDNKTGRKLSVVADGNATGFPISYYGQEIFLNGVNLVLNQDFLSGNGEIFLINNATGITGVLFETPIKLPYITGSSSLFTGENFQRNTSNIYFNGVRQQNRKMYIEGAIYDLLSGNEFYNMNTLSIYDNNNQYWEN